MSVAPGAAASSMPAFSLHHGALAVSNLPRALEFYGRVLGFSEASRVSAPDISLEIVFIRKGDVYLELFCHQQPKALPDFCKDNLTDFQVVGAKHVAFHVEDAQAFHDYLQTHRVDGLTEVFDNNPVYYYFFFRDPDGIPLEVISTKA